jgi:transmembrane sensor
MTAFDRRQAETAARLVARARDGDAADVLALRQWADSTPERAVLVASMQQSWEAVDIARDCTEMEAWRTEAHRHLAANDSGEAITHRPVLNRGPITGGLAAGLAAVLLVAGIGGLRFSDPHPATRFILSAPVDAIRTERLPDGSTAILDRGASLAVHFDDQTREVVLNGQGRFEVAHEQGKRARPFLVRVGDRQVMATGTKFNVLQESGRMEVSLIEGGVQLSSVVDETAWLGLRTKTLTTPIVQLKPGQRYVERSGQRPLVDHFNSQEIFAWEHGRIILDAVTLSRAAEIASRYSKTKIVIADADLAARRISGAFAVGNAPGFVETVGLTFADVRVSQHDGRYIVTRR